VSVVNIDRRLREIPPPVPHDVELERQVVALLLGPFSTVDTAALVVGSGFRDDDLFRVAYGPIARECLALISEGVKPSPLLVSRRLSPSELDECRGFAGLTALADGLPLYTPDQIAAMVKDLADMAWKRRQIVNVEGYRERLYDKDADVEALQVEPSTWQDCAPRAKAAALLNDVTILQTSDAEHIIRNVFQANTLAMIAGATGSGKTHLATSASVATALKATWFGRFDIDTPGHSLFVVGEGASGLKSRFAAAKEAFDCPLDFPLGIYLHLDGFSLQSDLDVSTLIRRIPGDADLRLVWLDTWARLLLPGDENSQRDAGIGIAAMDKIRRATGATVIAIHHLNATGERERGSTALKAAVDTAIRIVPQNAGIRRVVCDKQRDIAPFDPFHFSLMPIGPSVVPMWIDAYGEDAGTVDGDVLEQARELVIGNPGVSANQLVKRMKCGRSRALAAIKAAQAEQRGESCAA